MVIAPFDAWALRKQLAGHGLDGELAGVSAALRPLIEHLDSHTSLERRTLAWEGYLSGRADRDALIVALAEADPEAPPPSFAAPEFRFATAADVRRVQGQLRWIWDGWT